MNRIAIGTMGAYNELRAAQAQATRARILEATVNVMARGVASVSIPAVAREARVSVPTVYRHFGT
jgi:AcrR family transcriptional regulator